MPNRESEQRQERIASGPTRRIPAIPAPAQLLMLGVWLVAFGGCRGDTEGSASGTEAALAALDSNHRGGTPSRARRLWAGPDFNFFASSPSPDGRFVTEIDWNTGDLAVRDLSTGQLHRLTDKGTWEQSASYAEVASFTRDGSRVLYGWFNDATGRYEMRILDFAVDPAGIPHGTGSRVVHDGSGVSVFYLYDWLSDDEILTGIYRPDQTTGLAFLSLSTGTLRVLKSFDWRDAHAALSPDGRFVAYDHPPGEDPVDRDIRVMSVNGSTDVPLVVGPGKDIVLGWLPSGGGLLFHSERSGSPSLWRIPMSNGTAAGQPVLVRDDVRNLEPLGFAGNAFYYGLAIEAPEFRTATIDRDARRLIPRPTTFEAPWGGTIVRALAWSPDGEHVAHDADMTGRPNAWILVRRADGTPVREWNFELRLQRMLLHWMPDGSGLILSARDARGRVGFFRMGLESGELELLRRLDDEGTTGRLFSVSPDGRFLYFTQIADPTATPADRAIEIVERELAAGVERAVGRVAYHDVNLGAGHWSPITPSPDGKLLAVQVPQSTGETEIRLMPVAGGAAETLLTIHPPAVSNGIIAWEPGGQSLLMLVQPHPSAEIWSTADVALWRVSRNGEIERLGEIQDYAGGARLHPDGRTLAYRAGRYRGEVWAIDAGPATIAGKSAGNGRTP